MDKMMSLGTDPSEVIQVHLVGSTASTVISLLALAFSGFTLGFSIYTRNRDGERFKLGLAWENMFSPNFEDCFQLRVDLINLGYRLPAVVTSVEVLTNKGKISSRFVKKNSEDVMFPLEVPQSNLLQIYYMSIGTIEKRWVADFEKLDWLKVVVKTTRKTYTTKKFRDVSAYTETVELAAFKIIFLHLEPESLTQST